MVILSARTALALSALVLIPGCGSFQSSVGDFRTSSDYGRAPAASSFEGNPDVQPRFIWPVKNVRLTRGFRPASDRDHHGIDLGGRRGEAILASHDGVVVYAGQDFRGYGRMVLLEYNRRWATLYAHLDAIAVSEGQRVPQGARLGTMGRSGRATGVHLHFEVLQDKQPVDPKDFLPAIPVPRFAKVAPLQTSLEPVRAGIQE
jgi:murein DD-endopeptidase MepM/ murein hydrolase activator NlpD